MQIKYTLQSSARIVGVVLCTTLVSICLLALRQNTSYWALWIIAGAAVKMCSGLFVYGIVVDEKNRTVRFRRSFSSPTVQLDDIRQWGYKYLIENSVYGINPVLLLLQMKNGKTVSYPVKFWNFGYALPALTQKELERWFPGEAETFDDSRKPGFIADVASYAYVWFFLWI